MPPAFMSFILLLERTGAVSRHAAARVYSKHCFRARTNASCPLQGGGLSVGRDSLRPLATVFSSRPRERRVSRSAKPRWELFPRCSVWFGGLKAPDVDSRGLGYWSSRLFVPLALSFFLRHKAASHRNMLTGRLHSCRKGLSPSCHLDSGMLLFHLQWHVLYHSEQPFFSLDSLAKLGNRVEGTSLTLPGSVPAHARPCYSNPRPASHGAAGKDPVGRGDPARGTGCDPPALGLRRLRSR